jgi:hypothetical protein
VQFTFRSFGDDGWANRRGVWSTELGALPAGEPVDLGVFLRDRFDLPEIEANELAERLRGPLLDQWRTRGGDADEAELRGFGVRLLLVAACVIVVAIVGLVFVVVQLT